MENVIELLSKLVSISSVSGKEMELAIFIENLMQEFEVRRVPVGDRWNLEIKLGNPKIWFSTHLDTVPGEPNLIETAERVFGRGSCDAKASLAAFLCASKLAKEKGFRDFGIYLTVSEETDFSGAKTFIPESEMVIIGEPTKLNAEIAQRGILGGKIYCKGKEAHGARPEEGDSAILKLLSCISALNLIELPEHSFLGTSSLNIGTISGGTASNVVPELAQATFEIRTVEENKVYKELLSSLNAKIEYTLDYEPRIIEDEELMKWFGSFTKVDVKRAFTELAFWKRGVILGPGDPFFAHKHDEQIEKWQVEKAVEIYLNCIEKFCK